MKTKKIITLLLTFAIAIGSFITVFAAFDLDDGGPDEAAADETVFNVIDFNSLSDITNAKAIPSTEHTVSGNKFSALWEHSSAGSLDFKNIPRDWSDYYVMKFSVYGENTAGAQFKLVCVCDTGYFSTTIEMKNGQNDFELSFSDMAAQSGSDWKEMSYVRLSATGWGMTPTFNAKFYINNFSLEKLADDMQRLYKGSVIENVYDSLENGVAVYAESNQILKGENLTQFAGTQYKDEILTVPATVFSEYLGAHSSGTEKISINTDSNTVVVTPESTEYTHNGKTGNFKTKVYKDGENVYVPAMEVAELLEYETKKDRKLLLIGDEKIRNFDSYEKQNDMLEFAGYMVYHIDVDPATITTEDFKELKDRWRYNIVADENIDLNDPDFAKIAQQVGAAGNASWAIFKKDAPHGSLFFDAKPTASSGMSSEYQHILRMAKAWAQYGSEVYHNEQLKNDILYALEWMYENRYGLDEIANNENAWRDHTLTNWYDWQIASPQYLVDILMLMEEHLTAEQKDNYLKFFRYWVYERCYQSMFKDAGMNVLYTAEIWIGTELLREDATSAIEAVSSLHNTFSWADNFNTHEGFFTDGSCIFHYKHPMTGQYGIAQFEASGGILSVLDGTKLEFRNPRKENIFDWAIDAYEPLIFDGALFRIGGRNHTANNHSQGRQWIKGMIDLLDFADTDTYKRFGGIIKYMVATDKSVSWNDSSFTIPQMVRLKKVLADDSIEIRPNYYIGKVYHNMDKVVNQRKKWAAFISMSSTRVYDYESLHFENTKGWYLADGFTQIMVENDPTQFNPAYFSTVDPYKYPGTTLDTQERAAHSIATGKAFVKDFDDVGGVEFDKMYTVAAQHLNTFHLAERIKQGAPSSEYIEPHNSTMVARKSWFTFDDEMVCLGSDISANEGFEVRTIVENRRNSIQVSVIPEEETTPEYDVVGVEASQTPQSENTPENTLDGDFGTKWAGDGLSHIIYDLGEVKELGFAGFSFMSGHKRTQKIDIELSSDGINWKQMFAGNSGGKTEGIELFDMKGEKCRYIKLVSYGNSDGGGWISLTEAQFYPVNKSGKGVIAPVYLAGEKFIANGTEQPVLPGEKKIENVSYAHLANFGGYYFPETSTITTNRTEGATSFFEIWLSHGINPKAGTYSYVLLPSMSAEDTASYAVNPDIEVLINNSNVQSVYDKSTGITGIVFWKEGTFNGISVNQPMVMMYREKDGKLELSVADTTHKLNEATITFNKKLVADENLDYRMGLDSTGKKLNIIFNSSRGASIASDFTVEESK
ncbi:MAG: discoidin domain-containing protein [Clostridia bacterium]|nr:discoidin domain-containing protein [Clostridia bacterium]